MGLSRIGSNPVSVVFFLPRMETPFFCAKAKTDCLAGSGSLSEATINSISSEEYFEISNFFEIISKLPQEEIEVALEAVLSHQIEINQNYWTISLLSDKNSLEEEIRK